MHIDYRPARKEDCRRIAELDYIASAGAVEFLFRDLVPDASPVDVVTYSLEKDDDPHSYRNTIVAEHDGKVIGMALSYPAKFHEITDEMREFFPADRLEHFKDFFSSRVDDSYLLDALCVEEDYRGQGIGERLIDLTKTKALKEDYHALSLIVFADNIRAQALYQRNGFEWIKHIDLQPHELIPHDGGCVLMKANI